jgi:hypothetical protein
MRFGRAVDFRTYIAVTLHDQPVIGEVVGEHRIVGDVYDFFARPVCKETT